MQLEYKGNFTQKHDMKQFKPESGVLYSLTQEQEDGFFITYWSDGYISSPYKPSADDIATLHYRFITYLDDNEALLWKMKHAT